MLLGLRLSESCFKLSFKIQSATKLYILDIADKNGICNKNH